MKKTIMRIAFHFLLLTSTIFCKSILGEWLDLESSMASSRITSHIAANGALNAGIGCDYPFQVPDIYPFSWLRDSAISMASLCAVDRDQLLFNKYQEWTEKTRSQSIAAGFTKAWTRFNLTSAVPDPNWANPQYDGPALRSLSFLKYFATSGISPNTSFLKWDFDVVVESWNNTDGFEPWEELTGQHFYTLVLMERVMDLASLLPYTTSLYTETRNKITKYLQREDLWWNGPEKHFISTIPRPNQYPSAGAAMKLSQAHFLDVQTILALVLQEDPVLSSSYKYAYTITSDRAQSTFYQLMTVYSTGAYTPPTKLSFWEWNAVTCSADGFQMGPAIGRYPEDIWDGFGYDLQGVYRSYGAGFWFIVTFGFAEFLYKTASILFGSGRVEITDVSIAFWSYVGYEGSSPSTIPSSDPVFAKLLQNLILQGDSYMHRAKQSIPDSDFYISEQINSATGLQASSADLSWSYASFLSASHARSAALSATGFPEEGGRPCSSPVAKSKCPVVGGYSRETWVRASTINSSLECMNTANHCWATLPTGPVCLYKA